MIKLNDDLLRELGLDALPLEEKKRMLAHIYETLEMRVGMKLAQQMTDEQLDEFEQFIKTNDEAGALHWLETKFPHYKDVVSAEFENLKMEIRQVAPQILTASVNQPQAMMPGAGVAPTQPAQPGLIQPQMPRQPAHNQWQQSAAAQMGQPGLPQPAPGPQTWPPQSPPQPFGPSPQQQPMPRPANGFNVGYGSPQSPQSAPIAPAPMPPASPAGAAPTQFPQMPTVPGPQPPFPTPTPPPPSASPWPPRTNDDDQQNQQQPPLAA